MAHPDFDAFRQQALSTGYDEVLERQWPADAILDEHTHPFALKARVVQGEMWLIIDGYTRHLRPGDEFSLDCAMPHAERYGPLGATYWVARRHMGAEHGR